MALSRVASEIFNVEKYRDLEIPVVRNFLDHPVLGAVDSWSPVRARSVAPVICGQAL